MNREEFDAITFSQRPDYKYVNAKRDKQRTRGFWGVAIPAGFLIGCVGAAVVGTGAAILPLWVIGTFVVYGWLEDKCVSHTK